MIQVLLNGIVSGLHIGLLATAFSLVYVPTKVFHIALGAIFVTIPYVVMQTAQMGLNPALGVAVGVLVAIVLSLSCELANHARLERRRASMGAHLISSLGTYIVIVQVVVLVWGNDTQVLRTGIDRTFHIGMVTVTRAQAVTAVVSVILMVVFYTWLQSTALGLRFRALSDNPVEFSLRGYNVHMYRLMAFGLSGFLGGIASIVLAYDIGFDPHGGLPMLLLAIVAMIIGGRASFIGPALGGLLLGIVRSQVVWHLSARWQDVVTFAVLALFLYVRPKGICSRAVRLEGEG